MIRQLIPIGSRWKEIKYNRFVTIVDVVRDKSLILISYADTLGIMYREDFNKFFNKFMIVIE